MEPFLLLPRKVGSFSGMAIRQVTDAMSNVPCRGGEEEEEVAGISCRDASAAFRLKMVAIVAILIAGVLGVSIPLIGTKKRLVRTDSAFFAIFKAFAAGVILATGFVHMLPDGQEALGDPCLPSSPWSDFPFSGFVAMLSALATLVVDFVGTHFYESKHRTEAAEVAAAAVRGTKPSSSTTVVDEDDIGIAVEEHAAEEAGRTHADHATSRRHCHDRGGPCDEQLLQRHPHSHDDCGSDGHLSIVRSVVVSQILELGILSHSVIIGLSLGVSQSLCTIRPLTGALSFHQFFEGFALGGCISQAQFQNLAASLMACFFALTTPAGIAAGVAFASLYDPNSPRALMIEGVLDSVSAGILIYMALVDLIASDFLGHNATSSSAWLQLTSFVALFLGAGSMSLLALWA